MKCPYCGSSIERDVMASPLSAKRGEVFQFIAAAGQEGVSVESLKSRFFKGRNPITIRTTIFYINKVIQPMQVVTHGKRIRLQKK